MDISESKAYAYWEFLRKIRKLDDLQERQVILPNYYDRFVEIARKFLILEESTELLKDKSYQKTIIKNYGINAESCPIPSIQARYRTRQSANIAPKYESFTEIVKRSTTDITPSYALQCWLREKNTIEFLMLWEKEHNAAFNTEQAKALVSELNHTSTSMTLKKWIERTDATGLVSLPGRYGGTYADPVIAMEFEMWLLPEFNYTVVSGYYTGKHLSKTEL